LRALGMHATIGLERIREEKSCLRASVVSSEF
jgi:hypothetical protein